MLNPSNRKWLPPQMPLQLSSTSKFHNFYVPALNVNKTTFSLNNDYKNCIYSNHVKIDSNALLCRKSWINCVKLTTFLSNDALWYGPYDTVHMIWSIWYANSILKSTIPVWQSGNPTVSNLKSKTRTWTWSINQKNYC